VRIWLYEDTRMFMEGIIIGFDEYMNVVLDDAVEMDTKKNSRLPVGRCLLKGDSITLIQYVYIDTHSCVYEHTCVCVYVLASRDRSRTRPNGSLLLRFSHAFAKHGAIYFAPTGKHSPCGQPTRKTRDNRSQIVYNPYIDGFGGSNPQSFTPTLLLTDQKSH
jgi:small nuclear ribonucleoprotein (snRNP)-like protein